MQRLEKLAAEAANLPSQGVASTFAQVNVMPNRTASPPVSFSFSRRSSSILWRIAWNRGLPCRAGN